ncbi:hypothetical protein pb186bvf_015616 [Paramecium bursaria]
MKYQEQILFIISFSLLVYYSQNDYDDVKNRYKGIVGAMLFICMMGSLRTYNGPIKTWQYFWRFVYWLGVTYNAFLVYLSFQNEIEARQLMKLGDSKLGVPVVKEMHTYDDNCEFEWINIYDNLDHYFLVHCVNWFLVAFLLRDAWLLNFWSFFDEIIELSWQHILPHFRECWWDHVILDFLLGNTVFIFIGLYVSRKLRIEQYDWLGRGDRPIHKWLLWSDHRYFGSTIANWGSVTVNFLTGFFIMNQLWIQPKCWMVVYRLLVWFGMGMLSWKETWMTVKGETEQTGWARYLVMWSLAIETYISIKFLKDAGNIQYVETPGYILYPWIGTILFCLFYWIYLRYLKQEPKQKQRRNKLIKK